MEFEDRGRLPRELGASPLPEEPDHLLEDGEQFPLEEGESIQPEDDDALSEDAREAMASQEDFLPDGLEEAEGDPGQDGVEQADGFRARNRQRHRVRQGTKSVTCVFWQRGNCRNGDSCRFRHESEPSLELDDKMLEEVTSFLDGLGGQLEGGVVAARFHGLKKAQLEPHFDLVEVGKGKFYVRIRGRTFDGLPPDREVAAEAPRRVPRRMPEDRGVIGR